MLYLIIIIVLAWLSVNYDFKGHSKNKWFWYKMMYVAFVLIAGLRFRVGNDTVHYLAAFYYNTPKFSSLTIEDFVASDHEPFFYLLQMIVKEIFGRFYVLQLVQATFINFFFFKYFKKHSEYCFSCLFLYFVWTYFNDHTEEMRASMSVALCLYANDFFYEKKWLKGSLLVLIASMFHYSSLLLLLTPFLLNLKFNFRGIVFLIITFFLAVYVQTLLGDYLLLLNMTGSAYDKLVSYANSSYGEQIINIKGIIGQQGVIFIYSIFACLNIEIKQIKRLEPFLMIGLAAEIVSIPISIFYRYTHFYTIYFIIFFSQFFVDYIKNNLKRQGSLVYFRAFIISIPFMFYIYQTYFPVVDNTGIRNYARYYPYSSIIDRNINEEREKLFSHYSTKSIWPNKNEY